MEIKKVGYRGVLFTFTNPSSCPLNVYAIQGSQYCYVIDTGLGSLNALPIKEYMEESGKRIIVINTHHHFDHIWGNSTFQNNLIISHALCREMIASQWEDMMRDYRHRCLGKVQMKLPDLVFTGELHFAEDGLRLFHSPGHTMDSISVLDEKDRILIVADNIGESMTQIIPSLSCEKNMYRSTLEKYLTLDFDFCVSGHNKILNKQSIGDILAIMDTET